MAIPFRCPCGQALQAPDDQAGREMRCPRCRDRARVPLAAGAADGYAVERVRQCPSCQRGWPPDAVLCIDCGYNFETGRRLRTRVRVVDRVLVVGATWAGTYTRYRVHRDARGKPRLDITHRFLFLPAGSASHDLTSYSAIRTDYAPGDEDGDTYYLTLAGPGRKPVRIFTSSDDEAMRELIDLVAQAGGLEIQRD